ncbi:DUF502 domain-containing protein [Benzoatithermus flavus]|uniref:DUF502 domain-containing protein n=1 Tax=Benzoatithermus flavus TaxID=3108223 RepID=A0ABU8XRF0_9PROT
MAGNGEETAASGHGRGEAHAASERKSFPHRLRNYLFAGIIVAAPIGITLFIVWHVLRYFDQTVSQFIPTAYNPETYLPFAVPGIGLVVILGLLVLIGWFAAGIAGRTIMQTGEWLLDRTPIVRGIYGTLKQLFETMLSQSSRSFREVVMIEYPRPGIWSLGFVTGEATGEIGRRHGGDLLSVFVPTTPIPAYGFLLFLPRDEVVHLDMSVEDGMKLVISGGIVMPPERPQREPARPPRDDERPSAGGEQPHGVLTLEQVQ